MSYYLSKTLDIPFEAAVEKVTEALKQEGFGVLTEIDMKAKLKEKIGAEFRRYVILGACNPPLAHRALQAELDVGILLPCNVIVYETDDGKTQVTGFNPEAMLDAFGKEELKAVAAEISQRMRTAIEGL